MATLSRRFVGTGADLATDKVKEAITELGWHIVAEGQEGIRANTKASISSWGENVVARIEPDANGVNITVTSGPVAQLFDWGKSIRNVNALMNTIDRKLRKEE